MELSRNLIIFYVIKNSDKSIQVSTTIVLEIPLITARVTPNFKINSDNN